MDPIHLLTLLGVCLLAGKAMGERRNRIDKQESKILSTHLSVDPLGPTGLDRMKKKKLIIIACDECPYCYNKQDASGSCSRIPTKSGAPEDCIIEDVSTIPWWCGLEDE